MDRYMELRQLRYLIAIADHRSIKRAAESVRIAQPALSRQLRSLEEELGVELVERSVQGATLTTAGEAFVKGVRKALAQIDDTVLQARASGASAPIDIRVGLPPMECQYFGLDFIDRMATGDPPVRIRIAETWTGAVLEMIQSKKIDIGLIGADQATGLTPKVEISRPRLFLLSKRADKKISDSSPIPARDLAGMKLILPAKGHATRSVIEKALSDARVSVDIAFESESWTTVKDVIEAGRASAILTALDAVNLMDLEKASLRPIVEPEITASYCLVGNDSMATSTFLPIFHRIADEIRETLSDRV